ncbi:hypothetical protein GJU40_18395 [Bacillus lacus]|uniref:Uncharacterized protein n=1 Tax=Metabacillus lacus TaxID=1983721 RepID=A0A7X2J2U1_9BACI|nr:hypothetical protein [Metabacillus lacus]MRX74097.1 hypothetical protein [Metabacillus lacus]
MKEAGAIVVICLLLLFGFFFKDQQEITAVIFKDHASKKLLEEVLSDGVITDEEALLLISSYLERQGKSEIGVFYQTETITHYLCEAKWSEAIVGSGRVYQSSILSVDKETGKVKMR